MRAATTGVPVKSPSEEAKRQACASVVTWASDGPLVPPLREFARSFPYEGQSDAAAAAGPASASAVTSAQPRAMKLPLLLVM